jgi:hypothetical protein
MLLSKSCIHLKGIYPDTGRLQVFVLACILNIFLSLTVRAQTADLNYNVLAPGTEGFSTAQTYFNGTGRLELLSAGLPFAIDMEDTANLQKKARLTVQGYLGLPYTSDKRHVGGGAIARLKKLGSIGLMYHGGTDALARDFNQPGSERIVISTSGLRVGYSIQIKQFLVTASYRNVLVKLGAVQSSRQQGVDLAASYKMKAGIRITGQVVNALGTRTEEQLTIRADSATPSQPFYGSIVRTRNAPSGFGLFVEYPFRLSNKFALLASAKALAYTKPVLQLPGSTSLGIAMRVSYKNKLLLQGGAGNFGERGGKSTTQYGFGAGYRAGKIEVDYALSKQHFFSPFTLHTLGLTVHIQ